MRNLYLIAIALSLQPLPASRLAPWVGPNVRLGDDPEALPAGFGQNQAEPHVTRSVTDPDLVLATFQEGRYSDGGAVSNGYAVSRDGGFNWDRGLNPNLTLVTGGPYYRATDPVAAISINETLYLNSLVSVDESFGLGRLVLQRSRDHGESWTDPITIYSGRNFSPLNRIFPDKNWMVVNDIAGTPSSGRIVVTWTDFRTIRNAIDDLEDNIIMSCYSDDEGDTWSSPVQVTPPVQANFSRLQYQGSQPVFLPKGDLAIVYHNFDGSKLEVRYSPDGGESYPYAAEPLHDGYIQYDAPNLRDGSFLPSVDAATETGDIYIVYTAKTSPFDEYGHITFIRSHRDSADIPIVSAPEWKFSDPAIISGSSPVRVTCTPTISVSPDGQRVSVYFYDNRNGSGINNTGDFYAVQSIDGGMTWSDAFRLSESTFPLSRATQTNRGYMLGDYYGFAPPHGPDQAGIAVWVGTPLDSADPWSARMAAFGPDVFQSWLQANLPYSLRAGSGDVSFADPDRDGTPNFLEYLMGRSPLVSESLEGFPDGLEHLLPAPDTDPDTSIEISAGTGNWPSGQQVVATLPQTQPFGEGYWNQLTWPDNLGIQHLRITVNSSETWYLLDRGSPSRWVLQAGGNWVLSPWFGYFETTHAPWLFHEHLGWVYDMRGVLYSPRLDAYLFSSPKYHPWIYTSNGNFIYLSTVIPWIYEQVSGQWVEMY